MKIGEIMELTQTDSLANIAKERLEFGKKKATEAMQKAGCYTINGMRGWYFDGDPSVLEQSIYDFASSNRRKPKPSPNVSTNEVKNVRTKEPITNTNHGSVNRFERAKEEIEQANEQAAPTKERTIEPTMERTNKQTKEGTTTTNVVRKRSSFDIDVELMKDLKIQAIIHEKNVYEIVESAIRKELAEMKKGL